MAISSWLFISSGLLAAFLWIKTSNSRASILPPGPKGLLPFLGHIALADGRNLYAEFTKWKYQYGMGFTSSLPWNAWTVFVIGLSWLMRLLKPTGPVFSVKLAGTTVIVLNSFQAVYDLLGTFCDVTY